jgi:hypothetical protein
MRQMANERGRRYIVMDVLIDAWRDIDMAAVFITDDWLHAVWLLMHSGTHMVDTATGQVFNVCAKPIKQTAADFEWLMQAVDVTMFDDEKVTSND